MLEFHNDMNDDISWKVSIRVAESAYLSFKLRVITCTFIKRELTENVFSKNRVYSGLMKCKLAYLDADNEKCLIIARYLSWYSWNAIVYTSKYTYLLSAR